MKRLLLLCALGILPFFRGGDPIVIRMTGDHRFEPQVTTIHPGDAILWKNEGSSPQSVICDPLRARHRSDIEPPLPPEVFHSEDIPPGGSFRRTFGMEGVYRYVCLHHEEQGMNGTVIVTRR